MAGIIIRVTIETSQLEQLAARAPAVDGIIGVLAASQVEGAARMLVPVDTGYLRSTIAKAGTGANEEGEIPGELQLLWHIKRFGVSAVLGYGTLDYNLLLRMTMAENIYSAVQAKNRAVGEDIHKLPAHVHSLIDSLFKMGLYQIGPRQDED